MLILRILRREFHVSNPVPYNKAQKALREFLTILGRFPKPSVQGGIRAENSYYRAGFRYLFAGIFPDIYFDCEKLGVT